MALVNGHDDPKPSKRAHGKKRGRKRAVNQDSNSGRNSPDPNAPFAPLGERIFQILEATQREMAGQEIHNSPALAAERRSLNATAYWLTKMRKLGLVTLNRETNGWKIVPGARLPGREPLPSPAEIAEHHAQQDAQEAAAAAIAEAGSTLPAVVKKPRKKWTRRNKEVVVSGAATLARHQSQAEAAGRSPVRDIDIGVSQKGVSFQIGLLRFNVKISD